MNPSPVTLSDPRPAETPPSISAIGPPADAVTLAELVAQSGPLPPDAVLECMERLAERLASLPDPASARLTPNAVLLDDDGGVWLASVSATDGAPAEPDGLPMSGCGRLLCFLATGDVPAAASAAALPSPLETLASRLFSRNGHAYGCYADVARDAARLRAGDALSVPDRPAPGGDATCLHETPPAPTHVESPTESPTEPPPAVPIGVVPEESDGSRTLHEQELRVDAVEPAPLRSALERETESGSPVTDAAASSEVVVARSAVSPVRRETTATPKGRTASTPTADSSRTALRRFAPWVAVGVVAALVVWWLSRFAVQ